MSPAASTRWCPTPDQLMILEELYRSGIRTPNASQIQRITAHLSLYGKIEGKNVFYWFQNHKARDRQKLRRRLLKQLQQQQQQQLYDYKQDQLLQNNPSNSHLLSYFDPAATSAFHGLSYHHNSASILPHQGGTEGVVPTQLMNCRWKVDSPPRSHEMEKSVMMRMYSHDWMMMADAVGPPSPCCSSSSSTRPLQTLELFPITATNLKEESSSKHLSPPSNIN